MLQQPRRYLLGFLAPRVAVVHTYLATYYLSLSLRTPQTFVLRFPSLRFVPTRGMPCLTTSLYEGGYRKCDVNFHLNRVMEELKPVLCTWTGARGMNRHVAMPHLNTYYRYREIQRSDGELAAAGGPVFRRPAWCGVVWCGRCF